MKKLLLLVLLFVLVQPNLLTAQWNKIMFPVENGFNLGKLYVDGNAMWAGGTGRIFRSTDQGETWLEVSTGLQSAITMNSDIIRLGDRVYASFAGNGNWFTYYTTDDGKNWVLDTAGWQGPAPIQLHTHKDYILARCESNVINYKKNSDTKWSKLTLPESHRTPGAMYSVGDTLVLGANYIAMTIDMGANWIFRNANPTGFPLGFFHGLVQDKSNPSHIYANYQVLATSKNFLVHTKNNQISWDSISMKISRPARFTGLYANGQDVYLTYEGSFTNGDTTEKAFMSKDGASTWTNITENLYSYAPFKFHSVFNLVRVNGYLYASGISPQGIVRRQVGSSAGLMEEKRTLKFDFYPNPAQDRVFFESGLSQLKVWSMDGKLLKSIDNPGHSLSIDDLQTGYYILEAQDQKQVFLGKLLKY
jgi:hypothetical protein